MPELVRSVVSRVRVYFKDRRQSPRLRVRLVFTVGINREADANGSARRARTLQGHTRDISAHGLALLVPQAHLDGHHLAAEGRQLRVQLQMGGGDPINIIVMPRRYERLEEAELGCSYLIGAQIMAMSSKDEAKYLSFIRENLEGTVKLDED